MKKVISILSFLIISAVVYSQELFQVAFSRGETLSWFSYKTDQDIIIRISDDGKLLEWGTDPGQGRFYNDPRRLQPYLGRVEYFGQEYDSVLTGKVRSIGTSTFTYYDKSDIELKRGKLKSIGRVALDYYDLYEDASYRGKMKLAGSVLFSYYSSFDNEAFRGKIKSIQNNSITYYSSFDDKMISGKIKSIGGYEYSWYPSYDRYRGSLRSGSLTQFIAGITYYIM
jgi:hypothetical protein